MSKLIIGLTGGIGSGKTTVANEFAKLGISIVDADVIAREVVAVGSAGLAKLTQHFGEEILTSDGTLNRASLREIIFSNETERLWVNQLLHPMIRTQMLEQCQAAASPYALMVVPLLFENGLDKLVSSTLVVDVPPELQLRRTSQRDGVSASQVQRIIDSQISREQRLAQANDIITNSGDLSELHQQITQLHTKYCAMATQNSIGSCDQPN